MFSNAYFYYFLFSRLSVLFGVVGIVSLVLSIGAILIYLVCAYEQSYDEDDRKESIRKFFKARLLKISLIIGVVFTLLFTFMPNGKDVLAFAALKSVDSYIEKTDSTNLSPDGVLKNVDSTIDSIKKLLDVGINALENTVNKVEDKSK